MGNAIRAVGRMSSAMQKLNRSRSGSQNSNETDSDTCSQTNLPQVPTRTQGHSRLSTESPEVKVNSVHKQQENSAEKIDKKQTDNENADTHNGYSKNSNPDEKDRKLYNSSDVKENKTYSKTKRKIAFEKEMVDCDAFTGDIVRFDIKIVGDSDAIVEWHYEDTLLKEDRQHRFIEGSSEEFSLVIKNVNENNEGEYTCTCKSENQVITCSAELTVYGGPTV